MDPYIVFHGQPCSQGQEAGRKDPSLEELLQKQLHCRLMQPRPPAGSTQLFALIWYFLNLFAFFFSPFFFALKELKPGISTCPVKPNAEAPAGAECQPSPGDGHSAAALKVRRCSAPFTVPLSPVLPSCPVAFLPSPSSLQQ